VNGEQKIGFDDNSQRVAVTDFDFAAVDRDSAIEDLQAALDYAKSKIPELLDMVLEILISETLTAEQLKRRVFYFAFLTRRKPFASQTDLAKHLGITPAAVSQQLNSLCEKFPLLARLRIHSEAG